MQGSRTGSNTEPPLDAPDVSREVPELARLPDEVRRASKDRRLILFLGAGLSCAAGLPTWGKVKEELISKFRPRLDHDDSLRDELRGMDPYDCFEFIRGEDLTTYEQIVNKSLRSNTANMPLFKKLIECLSSLDPVSFVTTNFDDLLGDSGQFNRDQFRYTHECSPQELLMNKVFCIHGSREKNIFSKYDRDALYSDSNFKCFLNNLFGSYCVLFLGYSFNEQSLLECALLNRNLEVNGRMFSGHYALLPSDHEKPGHFALSKFYGIHVIRYDNEDSTHQKFNDCIFSWTKVKRQ